MDTEEYQGFKTLELKLNTDQPGQVEAAIATLGQVDREGDFTEPGFFGVQQVKMFWNHAQHFNPAQAIPIGKGQVQDTGLAHGDQVTFRGLFNMKLRAGTEAYEAVKFDFENPPATQEWSYGYMLLPGGFKTGKVGGQTVRILQPRPDGSPGAVITEVSPTSTAAAGKNTATLQLKGLPFQDETELVRESVAGFVLRAKSLVELRQSEGRELGEESQRRLRYLASDLSQAADELERLLLKGLDQDIQDALFAEYLRFQKVEAQLRGAQV